MVSNPNNLNEFRVLNDKQLTTSHISFENKLLPVDLMTSKDFHEDIKPHIDAIDGHLKDDIRVTTFRKAILHNVHLFRNRIVLNLNCSLGIYALFAAKAGAAKVYAIDNSNIVDYMQRIVQANGYMDIIKIIKGQVQHVELPVQEVDIIISDWMGYALFYQSTCADVIFARDKWLKKPNGFILPDVANLYIAAIEDEHYKTNNIDWWQCVYGFNMNCIRQFALKEPKYKTVAINQLISKHWLIKTLDLNIATVEDVHFCSKFFLSIQRDGIMDGITLYFKAYFSKCHRPLILNTDPLSPPTSWLQTVCYFDRPVSIQRGQMYYGCIEFLSPAPHSRNNPNLNYIITNYEMFFGDPPLINLITEMSWCMMITNDMNFNEKLNDNDNDDDQEKELVNTNSIQESSSSSSVFSLLSNMELE